MPHTPILTPASFAPAQAAGFALPDGNLQLVSANTPLPVTMATSVATPTPTPRDGTASASASIGPWTPVAGRPVSLTLSGEWQGMVRVLRSTDGGITKLPLSAAGLPWARFTANCCEAVWEESDPAAALFLDIALTAGAVTYRLA